MTNLSINPVSIGSRIRQLRKKQGKTQAYFADLLYISASYLALIESGKRVPTLEVLAQIALISDVTVDYLIFGDKTIFDEEQEIFNRLYNTYPKEKIRLALRLAEYYLNLETDN